MLTDITLNVSGVVTYEDGVVDEFYSTYFDEAVVNPSAADTLAAFQQLYSDKGSEIRAFFNALGGTHTFSPGSPTVSRTVSGYTLIFSGTVTRDDGTHGNFSVVKDQKAGNIATNASVYTEIRADATYKAIVKATLGGLAGGTANMTIA